MAGRFPRPARMGRVFGSPPRTAPSPLRGGQVGRAVFSALPAWAAEVVSSNIVGYTKVNVVSGLNMMAGNFASIGGGLANDINAELTSQDLADGSVAMFWNTTTKKYSNIIYYADPDDGIYTDDTYTTNLGAGWGDDDAVVIEKDLNLEIDISSFTSSDLPDGTVAMFWNTTTKKYSNVIYYADPDDGIYTDDTYETNLGAGWGDDDAIVVDKSVGIGEGFWIQSSDSAEITVLY